MMMMMTLSVPEIFIYLFISLIYLFISSCTLVALKTNGRPFEPNIPPVADKGVLSIVLCQSPL